MKTLKWWNIVLAILLVVITVQGTILAISSERQRRDLDAQKEDTLFALESNYHDATLIDRRLSTTEIGITLKTSLVEKRPAYLDALKNFQAAYDATANKVDGSGERQAVLDSQTRVLNADKAETVDAEIASVNQQTQTLKDKVAAYDAEQAAKEAAEEAARKQNQTGPRSSNPPQQSQPEVDWFTQMRQILNDVGGGDIPLEVYDGNCGDVVAVACTKFTGVIQVSGSISGWSYSRKVWAMRHELAHIYQIRVWDQIMNSPTYKSMFGSYIELLANCMAAAKGSPIGGSMSCSNDQVNWANNIWYGNVVN